MDREGAVEDRPSGLGRFRPSELCFARTWEVVAREDLGLVDHMDLFECCAWWRGGRLRERLTARRFQVDFAKSEDAMT